MKKACIKRLLLLITAVILFSLVLSASASADYPLWITKDLDSERTAAPGEAVVLGVEAAGGNGNITYQWYNRSGPINSTYPFISFSASTDDVIYCVMTSGRQSVESTRCTLNVGVSPYNPSLPAMPPQIVSQPRSVSVAPGQSTTLSVQASCPWLNGGIGLEYQWYYNSSYDMRYALPIEGATFSTYTIPPTYTPSKLFYVCSVRSTNGSDVSQDVLSDIIYVYCGDLNITKHPTGERANVGGKATFISRADGAVSFQWRIVRNDGSNGFYTVEEAPYYINGLKIYGADTDTLVLDNIPASMNGMSVICVFYGDEARTQYKISNPAYITVNPPSPSPTPVPTRAPTPTPTPAASKALLAPSISLRPEAAVSEDGRITSLSIAAVDNNRSGTELKYQWYRSTRNSNSGGTAIAGANSAKYTPRSFSDGRYYYVGVWATDGSITSKVSYSDTVLVDTSASQTTPLLAPSISVRPDVLPSEDGRTATLSVNAVDNNDSGTELEFQWYRSFKNTNSGGTAIAGAVSDSYVPIILNGSRYYYVGVWATDGDRTSKVSYSDPVLISSSALSTGILLAPSVSVRPDVAASGDGKNVFLSVRAVDNNDGTELKFQWYKNNRNSVSGGRIIAGADTADYVPLLSSDYKYYYAAVWATDGVRTSKVAYSGPVLVGTD